MKGQFDNNQPIFRQIIDQLLLTIATGELAPGDKVAPVREMAMEFRVNPNTMQKSLAKLEEMGYLFTERTSGRYVTLDLELIEGLKSKLPAQITEKYVQDMLECGASHTDIPEYVIKHLERMMQDGKYPQD